MANVNFQIQTLQVNATTTSGSTPIYLGGIKKIILRTLTADVYMSVDQPVATTTAYRIAAANTAETVIDMDMGVMTNLYLQAVGSNTTVYVILIVG